MIKLREKENAEFERRGWVFDDATGKYKIPPNLASEVQKYGAHGPAVNKSADAGVSMGPSTQPAAAEAHG